MSKLKILAPNGDEVVKQANVLMLKALPSIKQKIRDVQEGDIESVTLRGNARITATFHNGSVIVICGDGCKIVKE